MLYLRTKPRKGSGEEVYLGKVSHETERGVREGVVQVAAHHVDPVGAVPRVRVRTIQTHHVSQIDKRRAFFFCTNLGNQQTLSLLSHYFRFYTKPFIYFMSSSSFKAFYFQTVEK